MRQVFYIAASVIAVALSAAPAVASGSERIYNPLTNECLQPLNGSTAPGTAIVQQACDGSTAQLWTEISVSSGVFHYQNAMSNLCLDARGGASNGTPVQQWTCDSITNENWQPGNRSGGAVRSRVSGSSSYCLDVPGAQPTAGLGMQIYVCNGTGAQIWQLTPSGVTVPNLISLAQSEATSDISALGLAPKVISSKKCIDPGDVLIQNPGAGTPVPPGSTVTITIDSGTFKSCKIIK